MIMVINALVVSNYYLFDINICSCLINLIEVPIFKGLYNLFFSRPSLPC